MFINKLTLHHISNIIMDANKKKAIMECTSFDELLDAEYGERGTETRENFEAEAKAFCCNN